MMLLFLLAKNEIIRIFVLSDIYTSWSRHSSSKLDSALDFDYICPDGHIYAGTSAKLTSKLDVLLSAFAIFV